MSTMISSLGYRMVIEPLTADHFGPDGTKVLKGRVTPYTFGNDTVRTDLCFLTGTQGNDLQFFCHPELLLAYSTVGEFSTFAQIKLEDGVLHMQACHPDWNIREDAPVHMAPPVELAYTSADMIVLMATTMGEQESRCHNGSACQGAKLRDLDIQKSLLVFKQYSDDMVVVCSRCFREWEMPPHDKRQHLIFDGRRLPTGAPVPLWPSEDVTP